MRRLTDFLIGFFGGAFALGAACVLLFLATDQVPGVWVMLALAAVITAILAFGETARADRPLVITGPGGAYRRAWPKRNGHGEKPETPKPNVTQSAQLKPFN